MYLGTLFPISGRKIMRILRAFVAVVPVIFTCACFAAAKQDLPPSPENPTQSLSEWFDRFRVSHEHVPGIIDLDDAINNNDLQLKGKNAYSEAALSVAEKQKPLLTTAELADLLQTKFESISSFSVSYVARNEKFAAVTPVEETVEQGFSDSKAFVRATHQMASGVNGQTVLSLDGDKVSELYASGSSASIRYLDGDTRLTLLQPGTNPYAMSMMVDTASLLGEQILELDLVAFLRSGGATVYENPIQVEDQECLLVGNSSLRVYLSAVLNFAVVKIEWLDWSFDRPPTIKGSLVFEDFTDCGEGIWFPKVTTKQYRRNMDAPIQSTVVNVNSVSVNKVEDESSFADVIPDGISVTDSVLGISYIAGNQQSIEKALRSSIPRVSGRSSSPVRIFLLAINGVVLAVIAYIFLRGRSGQNVEK